MIFVNLYRYGPVDQNGEVMGIERRMETGKHRVSLPDYVYCLYEYKP